MIGQPEAEYASGDWSITQSRNSTRRAWLTLTVTGLGAILTGTNTSSFDIALPAVAKHFDATPTAVTWFVMAYALALSALILSAGRICDIVGPRYVYLAGVAAFTTSSLVCSVSSSAAAVIVCRAAMGAGAACIISSTTPILAEAFPASKLATGLGINVTISAAALASGPVIGGALVTHMGWNAPFIVNVPLGLMILALASRLLAARPASTSAQRFDWCGAVLSTLGVGAFAIGLSGITTHGLNSAVSIVSLALSALSAMLFVGSQFIARQPLLDMSVFADAQRAMAYASTLLMAIAYSSVVLVMSLFLQGALGINPLEAALRVLPMAIGTMLASLLIALITPRWPPALLASTGLAVAALGIAALSVQLSPHVDGVALLSNLFVIGAGVGLFMTPNTSSIVGTVAPQLRGVANGVRSTLQSAGALISVTLSLGLLGAWLSADAKRATFGGLFADLSHTAVLALTSGARAALLTACGFCVLGGLVSSLRLAPLMFRLR
jgi:EmrB/QacA subfamily drug resistance transporter